MRTVSTTAILRRNLWGTRVSASVLRRKSSGLSGRTTHSWDRYERPNAGNEVIRTFVAG